MTALAVTTLYIHHLYSIVSKFHFFGTGSEVSELGLSTETAPRRFFVLYWFCSSLDTILNVPNTYSAPIFLHDPCRLCYRHVLLTVNSNQVD